MERKLSFKELKLVFTSHDCEFLFNQKTQYIKITRGPAVWFQHAHKGSKDSFEKRVVGLARRRLGFSDMSDDEFYAPLD